MTARARKNRHSARDSSRPIAAGSMLALVIGAVGCEPSDTDGWALDASVDSPALELSAGDTSAGHFTVVTRRAPEHVTLLAFSADMHGAGCPSPNARAATLHCIIVVP